MKKEFGDYFLGLDGGTESLGWAVTDENYELMKFNGKAMWGVRLFEGGQTAEERRLHRSARRRQQRKVQRIALLQELFAEEICKKDPGFYLRLKESNLYVEDKSVAQPYGLFCEKDYTDKDYFESYPTIYHLRKELIENENAPYDVRLVYLALHHILKNRGHFLFERQAIENIDDFSAAFQSLLQFLNENYDCNLACSDNDTVKNTLKSRNISITEKRKRINELLGAEKKEEKEFINLMCGGKAKFIIMFPKIDIENAEIKDLTFQSDALETNEDKILSVLEEHIECVERIKAIYDWALLAEILNGKKFLSFAKVESYNKHHDDLDKLKKIIKKHLPEEYNNCFRSTKEKANYCAYVGTSNGKQSDKKCNKDDFCKYISGLLEKIHVDDAALSYLKTEAENRTLLPIQRTKDNSVIPYQIHLNELQTIIANASSYLPFLDHKDNNGLTVKEKILKIMTFRIPYYVGPLNDAHQQSDGKSGFCWIEKLSDEPIRPWNFDQVVDLEASAEKFITRMTNKCTYLTGEDVLPKYSLLYSEFTVLNELNNLKINGEKPPVELKQKIFDELFLTTKKVTTKRLKAFLVKEGYYPNIEKIDFTGIDNDFKSSLSSYIDLKKILGEKINQKEMVENTIRYITLFGDDRKMLEQKLKNKYADQLTKEELKSILPLKYNGWGRLSEAFLQNIYHVDKETGECFSIIHSLRETNNNLMELLSYGFDYSEEIIKFNAAHNNEISTVTPEIMDDLYVSPAIKRSLWQTLTIVQEIVKITGHPPKKIFVEMARGEEEIKTRKDSRKKKLVDLYKKCKEEERDWINEIENKEEHEFRQDRLYLYYTQMGRCMYTGERIELSALYDNNIYDIDHIFPRSKVKDDSLSNRVLVKRKDNLEKSDIYPIPPQIQARQRTFWNLLLTKDFISKEKYDRLTRTTPFSDNELASFINRQLVETRQSTKAAATLLKKIYDDQTRVVYVKAGNVSEFRQTNDMLKCRDVNDFHHAKDAYLNVVVGNVYDTKFTQEPFHYIKNASYREYSLKRMYDFNVSRHGKTAWIPGDDGTIRTVHEVMRKNNILFTRYATTKKGAISDQQILRKGNGQLPVKKGLPTDKYGGYNKVAGTYFFLVEYEKGHKKQRSIESLPVYLLDQVELDPTVLDSYCVETLCLIKPRILINKIKFNSLLEIDGFRMHISSRTGSSLRLKGANQFKVDKKAETTIRNISKYVDRCKSSRTQLAITKFDGLSAEENIALYDLFLEKLTNTVYAVKLSSQVKTLTEGRGIFIKMDISAQCRLLLEILHLFQCNILPADLKAINGGGQCGNVNISQNITNYSNIKIINQSPTGLFEQVVDILSL